MSPRRTKAFKKPELGGSRLIDWIPDGGPAEFMTADDPDDIGSWAQLMSFYGSRRATAPGTPLHRILEIAVEHRVRSIVIEYPYIDVDYRSEHARFYDSAFRSYPTVCHRLHFFTEVVDTVEEVADVAQCYRGYAVMRPLRNQPVGRTMIAAPPQYRNAVMCDAEDVAHLFGYELRVRAMPFFSQDEEYLRCAHAAIWMVLYHAHLRRGGHRVLPHEIHDAALKVAAGARRVPNEGLTPDQVRGAMQELGLSPSSIDFGGVPRQPMPRTLLSRRNAVARYLNSQLPPMIYNQQHVWLAVGYYYDSATVSGDHIKFVFHDDARGPYLEYQPEAMLDHLDWRRASPRSQSWMGMIPPAPSKLYLTAERAESLGRERLEYAAANKMKPSGDGRVGAQFIKGLAEARRNRLAGGTRPDGGWPFFYRTYATSSVHFKKNMSRMPVSLARMYREMNLPRYIWVVEINARELATEPNAPCVIGEAIIDGTAHHLSQPEDPALLARHIAGRVSYMSVDHQSVRHVARDFAPYASGCPNAPLPQLAPQESRDVPGS